MARKALAGVIFLEDFLNFILQEKEVERALDAIELGCVAIDVHIKVRLPTVEKNRILRRLPAHARVVIPCAMYYLARVRERLTPKLLLRF